MPIRALLLLAVMTLGSGCAQAPRAGSSDEEGPGSPLVWPAAPARPRVRFVTAVARPADLGAHPSVWRRLTEAIAGRQEEWLIRPTAAVASGRFLYVADPGAQAFWRIDTIDARFDKIQEVAGTPLLSPVAVAVGRGLLYVADSALGRVFVLEDAALALRTTIAGPELRRPVGLALDEARDRLYVADSAAHHIAVYGGDGHAVGTIGRRGADDGEFNFPTHVVVGADGDVCVTDAMGFRVQRFAADGRFIRSFGRHGDSSGDFASPKGIALDSEGHVYVVDALFDAVQIFDRGGQFLLSFGERGVRPGQFWLPVGVFIDGRDRVYVADSYNQRIQIFQYLAGGGDG
jgi:DNA-binding beta-propeller fold protein YncE